MTREEAVNWIINITADIGKAEHRDLWQYEQALYEIRELLEEKPEQPEPCEDAISRLAAITIPIPPKWNRKYLTTNLDDAYELGWDDCQKCIGALPSAQPERKKGKWIIDGHHIECNRCGEYMCKQDREGDEIPRNFCPSCGAVMIGEQDYE